MTLHYGEHCIDALKRLPPRSVQTCITSPPYWMMRVTGRTSPEWAHGYVGHLDRNVGEVVLDRQYKAEAWGWAISQRLADDGPVLFNVVGNANCLR
jgi:hypothetical protein